jgi:16S rRNA (uracil1498-N3)-methyltransferase
MRRSRLFQQQKLAQGTTVTLDREGAHYLGRVLRLKAGDKVNLFNSEDGEFSATLIHSDRHRVTVQLDDSAVNLTDPQLAVNLGLGLSRGERFDYAIQKSTELGVVRIIPLVTENCEVRLAGDRSEKKLTHWQRVAISACEQCGRSVVPTVAEPVDLTRWLADNRGGLLLDASGDPGLPDTVPAQPLNLLIGPEGGFSEQEVNLARQHDYQVIRLGPRILRTETAPVVALSLLQYLFGDLGK